MAIWPGAMVPSFGKPTAYTFAAFERALMRAEPFEVLPDPDDRYVEALVPGIAEGELVGGCLSLLASLAGTPWEVRAGGAILFFEDVHEAPYRVDRLLSQLLAAGALSRCAGIVIGEHVGCGPGPGNTLALEQVVRDLLLLLGVPALYHLPIGHGRCPATVPLGARPRLDADAGRLWVEPGVV